MSSPKPGNPKRRHGRVRCQDIECNLGVILDLSASGVRIRSRRSMQSGAVFPVRLVASEYCVEIQAIVRWTARAGLFSSEVGLEFMHVNDDAKKLLCDMARSAAGNDTIARDVRRLREADDRKAG